MVITTTHPDQQTWELEFSGKLNFQARQAYQQAINQAQAASPRHVIFNLTGVTYIDSAGLGLLTLTHKKFTESGILVSITSPQGSVKDVLELTNMGKKFPIYDSSAEASQGFKTRPH